MLLAAEPNSLVTGPNRIARTIEPEEDALKERTRKPEPRSRSRLTNFGTLLRQRGAELGLSGADVARRAGLSEKQYNHYLNERREPDLATFKRIAHALETSADALLEIDRTFRYRDERSEAAYQRFLDCYEDLSGEQMQMFADMALYVSSRRRDERWRKSLRGIDPLEVLAVLFERFLPPFVRNYRPLALDAFLEEDKQCNLVYTVQARLRTNGEPRRVQSDLVNALPRYLGRKDENIVRVRCTRRGGDVVAIISLTLGPKDADPGKS